jgi:hypothetical protein
VLADSPLGYWRLEETSGTVAADSSGHVADGAYLGGPRLGGTGAFPGSRAVDFDGVDDRIEVAGAKAPNPAKLTVELFAKSKTPTWNAWGFLASKRNAFVLSPEQGSKAILFYVFYTAAGSFQNVRWLPPAQFDIQQWHHYAASFDGQTLRLYADGKEVASAPATGSAIAPDSGPLTLGQDEGWANRYGNALIDEAAIYGSALPASRIAAHHAAATAGDGCSDIPGAVNQTYEPTSEDAGKELRVRVSALNESGTSQAESDPWLAPSG